MKLSLNFATFSCCFNLEKLASNSLKGMKRMANL